MQLNSYNSNNKIHSQTSFKAEIHIVDKARFDKELSHLKECFEVGRKTNKNWGIEEAAVEKPTAVTFDAYNCVVGAIVNPETQRLNMFHLSPYEKNMSQLNVILDKIFAQVIKLKASTDVNLQGFICGANSTEKGVTSSSNLLNSVMCLFRKMSDEVGLDYSIIAGRRNFCSGVNLLTDAKKNIHFLNPFDYSSPARKLENPHWNYEKIKCSPGDSFHGLYD